MPQDLPKMDKDRNPADFAFNLRLAVFETQREAADYFLINRSMISRYESGTATPPLGYLASLSCLLLAQGDEVTLPNAEHEARQQFLVTQIKKLVNLFPGMYRLQVPFSDWKKLSEAGKRYESKRSGIVTSDGPGLGSASGSAPPYPTLLLGRDDDLHRLKFRLGTGVETGATLSPHGLTIVRGWPGVGKTTLAAALAHDPDIERIFPDGVLWTSLGQRPSVFAELVAWGRALGHSDMERVNSIEEASARLSAILRNQRCLLIVDDIWDETHAYPFRVSGRGCALLFTTRITEVAEAIARTPDDIYLLDVLSEAAALELLRILAPGVVAADIPASEELVRELEGLPLAIQVAGHLLQSEAKMEYGVADLLVEIREGARLLEEKAPVDRTEVSNQMRPKVTALLQKSTDLLKFKARVCFAYLGAFAPKPATFDETALGTIWQVANPRPTIRTLVNRGLLEPLDTGRYWVHALLVAHARTLLLD
jgi:hypothetical protein